MRTVTNDQIPLEHCITVCNGNSLRSPNEIVALDDVDATVRLIAAFCRGLDAQTHFVPG